MLVRIANANKENPDQTASGDQIWVGAVCLGLFCRQCSKFKNIYCISFP